MKVLFCVSEASFFAKTGGLADVAEALPLALEKLGVEVKMVMPKYKTSASPRRTQSEAEVPFTSFRKDIDLVTIGKNIQVYLIKNDAYFNRPGIYGDAHGDYPDNLERFSFFCRRLLDLLKEINWQPQVIHTHDWQTALVAPYLRDLSSKDNFYKKIKTIFTIHNLAYQGVFDKEKYPHLGLDEALFTINGLEFYHKINLLKGGVLFSDLLTTVSPTYAKQIQTKEYGCGLEGVLTQKKNKLFGILNGLDYQTWNPAQDTYLYKQYSALHLEDKYVNKRMLQKESHLPVDDDIALLGMVGRLSQQKGWDLFAESVDSLLQHTHIQIVALGEGELRYQKMLQEIARKYPHNVHIQINFDEALARKIYAGADMFLMPSHYEPCGLGQMIALAYGAVPIVFKTGGLADTISKDNGFVFEAYTPKDFVETLTQALSLYQNKSKWRALVKKAFTYNFSWEKSAREYVRLYEKLLHEPFITKTH